MDSNLYDQVYLPIMLVSQDNNIIITIIIIITTKIRAIIVI